MIGRLLGALVAWAKCLFTGHDWRVAGTGHPDSASPYEYSACARCGADSRESWEIQDDTLCRLQDLHRKLYGPKDWSPRWRTR